MTGGSTHTHTPSAMDIGQPPGQASPGLFFISSHVAAVRLSALPLLPPQQATTRRNSNPSILASRVISLSQKIIATTALPLAHLSLLPAKLPLEGRQRETLRNLLRTLVSHLSLGEADRWSCRRRVDMISRGRSQDEETASCCQLGVRVVLIGSRPRRTPLSAAVEVQTG